jgi:hypothetical protein
MQESGINGPNGWEVHNTILQNEYYQALLGAGGSSTPMTQFESLSPNWVRVVENNAGTPFPNINRWALTAANLPLVMVRNLCHCFHRDLPAFLLIIVLLLAQLRCLSCSRPESYQHKSIDRLCQLCL